MQELEKSMQHMSLGGISTEQSITDMANADSDSMRMLEKAMQSLTIRDTAAEQNLSTAIATTSSSQARPSLLTIPQELRNQIFSYVFECETERGIIRPYDIHPSLDSILACRQLFTEFKAMHLHAFHSYWPKNRMLIYAHSANGVTTAINDLRRGSEAGLRWVPQLHILCLPLHTLFDYHQGSWACWNNATQYWTPDPTLPASPTSPHLHAAPPFAQYVSSKFIDVLDGYQRADKIGDPFRGRGLSFDCIASMLTFLEVEMNDPFWKDDSLDRRRIF